MDALAESNVKLDERIREVIGRVSPVQRFQQLDNEKRFDHDLRAALTEEGVWRLGVSETYGGSGGSCVDQMVVLRALGNLATSMGMFAVVQFLCTRILGRNATPEQRQSYLTPLLNGEATASFCLTEREGGTDILRVMSTSAKKSEQEYVINGEKAWICGATMADFFIVVARTGDGKTDGVSMFVVPADAPGVTARRIETFAINAYEVCDVKFDNVRVTTNNLLGEEGKGFRQLLSMLNAERLNVSANALGMAQGAIQLAALHASSRSAFGKTLSEFQAVQHKLANAALSYELAWNYLIAAAKASDRSEPIDVVSSMCKLAAVNAAQLAADVGMETMGASAFEVRSPMQRYYRDYRLYVIAPLNNDMSRSLIAERYFNFKRGF